MMHTVLAHTTLARHNWPTENVTAHHFPDEPGGMKYVVRYISLGHHIEIHCPTSKSALRLFSQILAYHRTGKLHPFLTV